MVDRRNYISKGETRERSFRLKSVQFSTKRLSYQNVNEWGERASLPYPTRGFKKLSRSSIYEGGYPGRGYAGLNLFDENRGEPKLFKNQENKGMSQSIKRIGQIQFYGHSGFTPFSAGVNGLLDQEDVITYLPA